MENKTYQHIDARAKVRYASKKVVYCGIKLHSNVNFTFDQKKKKCKLYYLTDLMVLLQIFAKEYQAVIYPVASVSIIPR